MSGVGVLATRTEGASSPRASRGPRRRRRRGRRRSPPRPRTPRPRLEVGRVEVDAEGLGAREHLVVAEHAVAAVVDDHAGQRDLLLGHGGELAAGEQEAAVAADRSPPGRPARRRGPPGRRSRAFPSRAAPAGAAERRACGSRRASSRGCTCRRPARRRRGRRSGSRRGSAGRSSPGRRRPTRERRRGPGVTPRSRTSSEADDRRVGRDVGVDAVVGRPLEPDRDQRLRLWLGEVLGLDAVEVRADRQHDVGLVPQAAGGLDVRREPDQARVVAPEQAGRAVGGQHGRAEPRRERAHGLTRITRATTRPDQRRCRVVEQRGDDGQVRRRLEHRRPRGPVLRHLGRTAGRWRSPGTPGAWARSRRRGPRRVPPRPRSPRSAPDAPDFTTGANIADWPSVSCRIPRYSPAPAQGRRDVGGDDQDRRARRPRLADRAERVGRARPGGRQRDAELAGGARVAVGGVGRGLLVADADQPDRGFAQRCPEREVVHAWKPETDADARSLELGNDDLRSGGHLRDAIGRSALQTSSDRPTPEVMARRHAFIALFVALAAHVVLTAFGLPGSEHGSMGRSSSARWR